MYEYSALGRYTQPSATSASPWPIVETELNNIRCTCYENAPREEILRWMVPKSMEIHVPGHDFVCSCTPKNGILDCPEEVHEGADIEDPWRHRRCREWRESWEFEAANIVASEGFRDAMTEQVLDEAGITGWRRMLAKSAEFVQIVEEREKRARMIKITGGLVLMASAGALTWRYLKNRKEAE